MSEPNKPTWKHVEIALLAIEDWKEEQKAESQKKQEEKPAPKKEGK